MAYLADLLDYAAAHLKLPGGLHAEYYNGTTLDRVFGNPDQVNMPVMARTDPTVDFDWGAGPPAGVTAVDDFWVRWTGQVEPRFSETYTLFTVSDDGVRLWVNGRKLIDNWTDHGQTENQGTIDLTAGQRYDIRLEYYRAHRWRDHSPLLVEPQRASSDHPRNPALWSGHPASPSPRALHQPFDRWPLACDFADRGSPRLRSASRCCTDLEHQ